MERLRAYNTTIQTIKPNNHNNQYNQQLLCVHTQTLKTHNTQTLKTNQTITTNKLIHLSFILCLHNTISFPQRRTDRYILREGGVEEVCFKLNFNR